MHNLLIQFNNLFIYLIYKCIRLKFNCTNQIQTFKKQIIKIIFLNIKKKFIMSKNLIISRLNKYRANEFIQFEKYENKTINDSKESTSTKIQQSPISYILNPEFTFKQKIIRPLNFKSKTQQFFHNFDPDNQIAYQKIKMIRKKSIGRVLEFQLLKIYNEQKIKEQTTKVQQIYQNNEFETKKIVQNSNKRRVNQQFTEKVRNDKLKTEGNNFFIAFTNQSFLQNIYANREEIIMNDGYDSNKYKINRQNRQKASVKQQQIKIPRFFTENSNQKFIHPNHVNNYKQYGRRCYASGDNLIFGDNRRKCSNSIRLALFRKQRQYQRKSMLKEYQNKRLVSFSYQNLKNRFISNIQVDCLPNLVEKKLKNQYSERYLLAGKQTRRSEIYHRIQSLSRKHHQKDIRKQNGPVQQNRQRIKSIRNQLNKIYDANKNEKLKLKIIRDQSHHRLRRTESFNKI